ncbi:MAG: DUF2905 domain-containing protein [Syntrophales bacterium]
MQDLSAFGKILIIIGLITAGIGLLFLLGGKIPWLGRLPGDFYFKGEKFTFYFPLATSILVSIILSLILYLFFRK